MHRVLALLPRLTIGSCSSDHCVLATVVVNAGAEQARSVPQPNAAAFMVRTKGWGQTYSPPEGCTIKYSPEFKLSRAREGIRAWVARG